MPRPRGACKKLLASESVEISKFSLNRSNHICEFLASHRLIGKGSSQPSSIGDIKGRELHDENACESRKTRVYNDNLIDSVVMYDVQRVYRDCDSSLVESKSSWYIQD